MTRSLKLLYRFILFLTSLVIFVISTEITLASNEESRTALIIGNGSYKNAPLKNPIHDAKDIASALRKLGFKVIEVIDADIKVMDKAVNNFGRYLEKNSGVGIFYFAGHGIQSKGRNYLIPVSANINRETDLKYEALDAGKIFDEMGYAENRLNIVILDACRNNPLSRSFRSGKRGLARPNDTPSGLLLAYSTSPGKQAADGEGRNSPYTKALLSAIQKKNLPLEMVFKDVIKSVKKKTKGQQIPWVSSSVDGDFYFIKQSSQNNPENTTQQNILAKNNRKALSSDNLVKYELLYWEGVIQYPTKEKYQAYIDKYPNGHFIEIAKSEVAQAKSRPIHSKPTQVKSIHTSSTMEKESIDKKLTLCHEHLAAYRLSTGTGGNAYDCFNKVLDSEPNNKIARDGLIKIEKTYISLISNALSKKKNKKAKRFIAKLKKISPNNIELEKFQKLIINRDKRNIVLTHPTTTMVKNEKPESSNLSEEQQQIFEEYLEVVNDFLSERKSNNAQLKKVNLYISKLEKLNPNDTRIQKLKEEATLRNNKLDSKQKSKRHLSENDEQIFDEYLEVVTDILDENILSATQLRKLEKYINKLEVINPEAPELIEAKEQFKLKRKK